MKLSTKGKYGIKALLELALREGAGPMSLKEIADRQGLSEHYLEQLAAPLRKAGLISSVRGAQGGYVLARPAKQISIGDVLRVLEGPIGFVDCDCSTLENPVDIVTYRVWERVTDQIVGVVDTVTLFDLADQAKAEQGKDSFTYQI